MGDNKEIIEFLNGLVGFNTHNGIEVTNVSDGYCEAVCRLTENSFNPQGIAHGSLIFGLCDVVTGTAAISGGRMMVTLNSSINFLRPGTGEYLRAVGKRIKDGKTTGLYEAYVYDQEGREVAKGDFTIYFTGGTAKGFIAASK